MWSYLVWPLAIYGAWQILRALNAYDFGITERRRARPRSYPALPYTPVEPGDYIRVEHPDGHQEQVQVDSLTYYSGTTVPQLLYFKGKDGFPGVCHSSKARLVGFQMGKHQFEVNQLVRAFWDDSPVVRFEFISPHVDPKVWVAYCRDLDGHQRVYPYYQLIPFT